MRLFDGDTWQEIFATLRQNKLRTLLTGFSVAWGIFILVVLLGSGNGLAHGVEYQFRDDAINSVWISSGQTSIPHKGYRPGRTVQFTNDDYADFKQNVPGVEHITSRYFIRGQLTVAYKNEHGTFDVRCVHPDHKHLERTLVTQGRFLNDLDVAELRKVAVIGKLVVNQLFASEPPIGKYLTVNGVPFQVVGIFEDAGGEGEMEKIYLPISTAQRAFGGANHVAQIMATTGDATLTESEVMVETIRGKLAARHSFAPDDVRAASIRNNVEFFQRFNEVIGGIRLFVWVIGVGTLIAGVMGVSNILMIVVKERTREIGVRKALGATPASVVGLILQEAVLITTVAGYVGLVLGVAVLEVARQNLPQEGIFLNPEVHLSVAVSATLLLILAGTTAGFFPARRAARIRPIEALREE